MKTTQRIRMISRLAAYARLMAAALVLFQLGVSCSSPVLPGSNGSGIATGIRLAIGSGDITARTVLPTIPAFTKYVVAFTANDSQTAVSDRTLTGAATLDIALDPGSWTITVYGYAKPSAASDEVVIAEGSANATVTAGVLSTIPISISASLTGNKGSIPYSISLAGGIAASAYSLTLSNITSGEEVRTAEGTISGSAISGIWSVDPGYYLATLSLTTSDSIATKQEVVHVYSNLATPLSLSLAAADFMDLVTLSGSLDVALDGTALSSGRYTIYAYTDRDDFSGTMIGSAEGSMSGAASWTIRIPAPAKETPVYFYAFYDSYPKTPAFDFCDYDAADKATTVADLDIDGIALSLSEVTISGTFVPIVDGVEGTFDNACMSAYADAACKEEPLDVVNLMGGTTWTMHVPSAEVVRPIYFKTDETSYGSFYYDDVILSTACSVGTKPVSDIALTIPVNTKTLSGTFAATIDGIAVDLSKAEIYLSAANGKPDDTRYYRGTIAADGTWTVMLSASSAETTYQGFLDVGNGELLRLNANETITVPAGSGAVADIALTAAYVSMRGTVTTRVDGASKTLPDCYVYASEDASPSGAYIGSGSVDMKGGAWTVYVPSSSASRDIRLTLVSLSPYVRRLHPTAIAVSTDAVSGVALDFNITTTKIGGFVSNHEGTAQGVMLCEGSSMPSMLEATQKHVAMFETDGDVFSSSIDVDYLGTSYYFVVGITLDSGTVYYASPTPIELTAANAESVELDISKMSYLGETE